MYYYFKESEMLDFHLISKLQQNDFDLDSLSQTEYQILYEHYMHEMPYGAMKARDADPDDYLIGFLERDFG